MMIVLKDVTVVHDLDLGPVLVDALVQIAVAGQEVQDHVLNLDRDQSPKEASPDHDLGPIQDTQEVAVEVDLEENAASLTLAVTQEVDPEAGPPKIRMTIILIEMAMTRMMIRIT